jgi:SAM-dependent methyltransferase
MSATAADELRAAPAVRCILCGQDRWRPRLNGVLDYLTNERFDIDRCESCGLMMTRSFPDDARIERYYPPRYRGNRHGFTGKMRVALRRRAIESRFPKGFRGRLLDVGCGDGAFVLEMKRRGWDVGATEIDPATVQRLRAGGVDAKPPTDAERQGFDQPFDAVTCWHVLEHVERPQEVAAWVKRQMKPSGIFQATVPNAESLQARLFGRNWMHFDVPRHRYHFTPETFRSLVQTAGFTVADSTCFALEYDWLGVIQSAINPLCSQPNVLFEKLTQPPVAAGDASCKTSVLDTMISYLLAPPLAAVSLPPLLIARMVGDGATLTLTLTCKPV